MQCRPLQLLIHNQWHAFLRDSVGAVRPSLDLRARIFPTGNKNQLLTASQASTDDKPSGWRDVVVKEDSDRHRWFLQLHVRVWSGAGVLPDTIPLYPAGISNPPLFKCGHCTGESRSRQRSLQTDLQLWKMKIAIMRLILRSSP